MLRQLLSALKLPVRCFAARLVRPSWCGSNAQTDSQTFASAASEVARAQGQDVHASQPRASSLLPSTARVHNVYVFPGSWQATRASPAQSLSSSQAVKVQREQQVVWKIHCAPGGVLLGDMHAPQRALLMRWPACASACGPPRYPGLQPRGRYGRCSRDLDSALRSGSRLAWYVLAAPGGPPWPLTLGWPPPAAPAAAVLALAGPKLTRRGATCGHATQSHTRS